MRRRRSSLHGSPPPAISARAERSRILFVARPRALPTEEVDGPVARRGDDPPGRIGRDAVSGHRSTAAMKASCTASSASRDVTEERARIDTARPCAARNDALDFAGRDITHRQNLEIGSGGFFRN